MYHVLLVDDEILIREAVGEKIMWNDLGYELAASCENGIQAKEILSKQKIDLVLTDICMPYMDGLELSEYLHHDFPNIQIIILSGYDDFDYAKQALKYSVSDYLLKPITALELSDVLIRMREKLDKLNEKKEQIDKISSTYHKNRLLIKSNVLMDLFLGNKTEEENRIELEEMGISLQSAAYRAAIVEIDIFSGKGNVDEAIKRESALMAFVVYNVANEIVGKYQVGEVCQGTDQRTAILFCTNKPKEFAHTVYGISQEIKEHLSRIMGFEITISIGFYVNEIKDIYKSYLDAKDNLEYRYILGGNQIIDKKRIDEKRRPWTGAQGDVKNLSLCIKKNDIEQMQCYFSDIKKHMEEAVLPKNKACLYLQQIADEIGGILEAFDMAVETGQKQGRGSVLYQYKEKVITEIYEAERFEAAAQIIENYCKQTAAAIDNQKNTGGKKYALMAMDFIEKNYADCTISLNSICTYLNISTSRFSSIFKNATGETFMDVLIRLRMQKSKELIKNTDLKNYEIAEKVGFSDPHYFSVVFKKMTGKTPSEYAREGED